MEAPQGAQVHTLEVPEPQPNGPPPDHGEQVVVIKRPKEIACFSFDDDHAYRPDDSSLRWYQPAQIGADLSAGFDTFDKLDDSADEHLDFLLRSLKELEQRQGERVEADIVTWRGMLTTVLTAPYEADPDGYASLSPRGCRTLVRNAYTIPDSLTSMNATCFQGTILLTLDVSFIEQNHAAKMARQVREASRGTASAQAAPAMASYWGYKYETLATIPAPWSSTTRAAIEARPSDRVANKAQFVSVALSRAGAHSFLIGGEVDALWDAHPAPPAAHAPGYVELKTARLPGPHAPAHVHARFAGKMLRFWAQSFLLGVQRVVVGVRGGGAQPRLEREEVWDTGAIPRMVGGAWDKGVCVAALHAWLAWVKRVVGGSQGVWRLAFGRAADGRRRWEAVRVAEAGVGDVVSSEFVEWRTASSGGRRGEGLDRARPDTPPSC